MRRGEDGVFLPEYDQRHLHCEGQRKRRGPRPLVSGRDAVSEDERKGEGDREPDHDGKGKLAPHRRCAEGACRRKRAGPGLRAGEPDPAKAKEIDHGRPET